MKKQGFGKDDMQPKSQPESPVINTEKADAIIAEVLLSVGSEIAGQAGLPAPEDVDVEKLLALLATVGVKLELSEGEMREGKPTIDVMVKQTVGTIDLSDALEDTKGDE